MENKKDRIFFARKEFLNLPGLNSTAAIVTHIVECRGGYSRYPECLLSISDCSRVIDLDIDLSDDYERENAIHKVDTLIDVLSDFKKALKRQSKKVEKEEKKADQKRLKELTKELEKEGKLNALDRREYNELRAKLRVMKAKG